MIRRHTAPHGRPTCRHAGAPWSARTPQRLRSGDENEPRLWAFGPMVTRFVPRGYQPEHSYESEPVAEKVHRAVEGLGDLIDGYEFHYPDELSPANLDEVRAALGPDHDVYCIAYAALGA